MKTATHTALGFSDTEICGHCGRTELRRTILVAPVDADGTVIGEAVPFGTTCAAKATGRRTVDLVNEAAAADTRRAAFDTEAREFAAKLAAEHHPVRAARFVLARAHRAGETHPIYSALVAEAAILVGGEKTAAILADLAELDD